MSNISPPVFYYHSVAPRLFEKWPFKGLTFPLQYFEDQLIILKSKHFKTIFLEEWLAIRQGEKSANGREICLAFDDGYLDNWVYALPMAKKYGVRFTLFVSPECVDPRDIVRPTLEDVWNGNCREEELNALGYLSWNELKLMQESGFVDVQSHTMSHDKYVASTQLSGFYYGGAKGVYPIWNMNPVQKPFYMADSDFEKHLPWGTPLFEEKSAVIVRKHSINSEFVETVADVAKKHDLHNHEQRQVFEANAKEIYDDYCNADKLLLGIESKDDYQRRVSYEVISSKNIIEEKLQKPISFLCWPHGDNTQEAHDLAIASGYRATTSGKLRSEANKKDRIPRLGGHFTSNRWVSRQKFNYKIASHYKKQPYYTIWLANELKNNILQRN